MDVTQRIAWDRALRNAVLAGDDTAWRTLYERCFDPLFAYIHGRSGRDMQRTEEALQECWMVAVRRMRKFEPERGSFESWLRGIADNVLGNHWRRWRRHERAQRVGEPLSPRLPQPGGGPDQRMELEEQITMAMAALPARYQAVLQAKYTDELSVAEIAGRWGETAKAIESLLARARGAFRKVYRSLDDSA